MLGSSDTPTADILYISYNILVIEYDLVLGSGTLPSSVQGKVVLALG